MLGAIIKSLWIPFSIYSSHLFIAPTVKYSNQWETEFCLLYYGPHASPFPSKALQTLDRVYFDLVQLEWLKL